MTNGKELKAMFPSMKVVFITESQIGIYFVKNQHSANVFDLDWWNEEYKEPIAKNDSSELAKNSKKLEKNFGESDCISRVKVIDYLCKHCPDDGECFEDCDEIKHLRNLPSVTPQEPRKGHWISRWYAGHDLHFHVCSECNEEFSCDMETGISIDNYRYCPNCGAKMVEPQESED